MFFEESANLKQDTNDYACSFLTDDHDFKDESELFSRSTNMFDKQTVFAQAFIGFEFKGLW